MSVADLRDVVGDAAVGLLTLPVALGGPAARAVSSGFVLYVSTTVCCGQHMSALTCCALHFHESSVLHYSAAPAWATGLAGLSDKRLVHR